MEEKINPKALLNCSTLCGRTEKFLLIRILVNWLKCLAIMIFNPVFFFLLKVLEFFSKSSCTLENCEKIDLNCSVLRNPFNSNFSKTDATLKLKGVAVSKIWRKKDRMTLQIVFMLD